MSLPSLYPYQLNVANAVLDSVYEKKGLTFSVEIARQGGKNEISAQVETTLLMFYRQLPLHIVKCSPTFKPQTLIFYSRLKDKLNNVGLKGGWLSELGYVVRYGSARAISFPLIHPPM